MPDFEIFLAGAPGLEEPLCREARALGLRDPEIAAGGVSVRGDWGDVWRANLHLRGAGRVLARIGGFRAFHLAQLDKRARKFPWSEVLRNDVAVRVEATCHKSKVYHAGAASQRVANAIAETLGAPVSHGAVAEAPDALRLLVRIDDNNVTFSVDTSGVALHKRGHKAEVGKAPMRETLAALFLAECGHDGSQTVVDPMCGSGTFVIEAAEIAAGLAPGRSRSFDFERLATFDAARWVELRAAPPAPRSAARAFGYDRDDGAIRMSQRNAESAGVSDRVAFGCQPVSALEPPDGAPGIVMVNPPYGARIGNKKLLFALYGSLGSVLKERFGGWRVGLVTSDRALARATGLPFLPEGRPVSFGGLKVRLYRTGPLP